MDLPLGNSKAHNRICLVENGVVATNAGASTVIKAQPGRAELDVMKHLNMRLSAPAGVTSQGCISEREGQCNIAHFWDILLTLKLSRAKLNRFHWAAQNRAKLKRERLPILAL
jgi:hypothetical protein